MEALTQSFSRDELVLLQLRKLFEQRGFTRVKTGKFEEYALYVENKNFLDTESIITFMDLDGKLMALKPDATLSIVKNVPRKAMAAAQKLYYVDEVYRLATENREYKVHNQIGVELIGADDCCANLEIIDLALESLGLIGERFAMDISHLGFVSGLLADMGLSHRAESMIMDNIHAKNAWDISRILEQEGINGDKRRRILALVELHGGFSESLERARELVCNPRVEEAWQELAQVGCILKNSGCGSVNMDFSVVNDLDYYNGLIFRGYVEGVPSLVLTGGRYDNLLRRMGKQSRAIGFAVSLDELGVHLKRRGQMDFDLLISYAQDCDFAALLTLVKELNAQGKKVRLEREDSDLSAVGLRYGRHMRYRAGELEEVAPC